MNARERMLTALDVQQPDWVPVWIHAINKVAIANIGRLLRPGVPVAKAVNLMSQEETIAPQASTQSSQNSLTEENVV